MPYLRLFRARYHYRCGKCEADIRKGQSYFRDDPHPFAKYRGRGVATQQLCLRCVLGPDAARDFFQSPSGQLPLGFELTENKFLSCPAHVEIVDLTPQLMKLLASEPERLRDLNPQMFENLICDRLDRMGYGLERVGMSTYQKDGGIDIVAWPRASPLPFLVAVQVKHTRRPERRIGPEPVRELLGAVQLHGFNAGLLVTNTSFTPDAEWVAARRALLMRLRDFDDLARWLRDEYPREAEWREIPAEIEMCPGVVIKIPRH